MRSEVGFTQGLEWRDGKLYESTGAIGGRSGLNLIAPDGSVTNVLNQGTRVFGEGLTILNDEMFQLTWQEHEVFVYDLAGKLKRTMRNPREGWGLTNDGESLIFSDGGPSFFFADPKTFAVRREVKLRSDKPGDDRRPERAGAGRRQALRQHLPDQHDPAHRSGERLRRGARRHGLALATMTDADKKQVTADSNNVLNGIAYDKDVGPVLRHRQALAHHLRRPVFPPEIALRRAPSPLARPAPGIYCQLRLNSRGTRP